MTPPNQSERTRRTVKDDRSEEADRSRGAEREADEEHEHEHEHEQAYTPETCPECSGPLERDAEHGELACGECGLVVKDDEIDHGPDWRAFDAEEREKKKHTGAPTTQMMHDKGLSTTIDWRDSDAYGNTLSSRQRQKMNRLRTWDERFRTRDARERNLKQALSEINRMASALGLPEALRETASVIYRRALEDNLLPGRSIEGVATAAVYAAARQAGMPRSLDEIVAVSRIERKELMRTYRYMVRELGLEIAPADPLDYLPRFASGLGVSDKAEQRARELLEKAAAEGYLSGKNPVGLAASALYASALLVNEKVTQTAVSEVADISEVTIRNRYQELLELEDVRSP